jgi:APA family basic amino acid/polyamine antiporter
MADITASGGGELKPTLNLTGVTINAMALIAPGAFLWTTFQEQSGWGYDSMELSVLLATLVALMTASCYAVLSKEYPQAGAGSAYFYAEAAFLEKESHSQFKMARIAKLIVGCAAHIYYWVYPAVMVSFMGILIVFITQTWFPTFGDSHHLLDGAAICLVFSGLVGYIAFRGVTGSTMVNIIINIIQIVGLVTLTILAIVYRMDHPHAAGWYEHGSASGVFHSANITQLLFQTTISILLVVGFESATALAAEAKNPLKDIPRGVILSLIIQAVVFYTFEYFGANYFIGQQYGGLVDKNGQNFVRLDDPTHVALATAIAANGSAYAGGSIVTGFAASIDDAAPIGSFSHIIGDSLLHGKGLEFELIMASTVVLALIGTALSCLSTAVRVSYAMGKDDELPGFFGSLHGEFNTPANSIWLLTAISGVVGAYGFWCSDNLLQITLISNLGTFLLYGMTCIATFIAFSHRSDQNFITTKVFPIIGAFLNFGLMCMDIYFAFFNPNATANTKFDTQVALIFSFAFMVIAFGWLAIRAKMKGEPMLLPPNHKTLKVESPTAH